MPFSKKNSGDSCVFDFDKLPLQNKPLLGNRFDKFLLRRRPTIWKEADLVQEYRRAIIGFLNLTPDARSTDWKQGYYFYQIMQCPQLFHFPEGVDPAIRPFVDRLRWDVGEFLRLREAGHNPMAHVDAAGKPKFPKVHGDGDGI